MNECHLLVVHLFTRDTGEILELLITETDQPFLEDDMTNE